MTYAEIWKMFLDSYGDYADRLIENGVEEELAHGFKEGFSVIMSLFMANYLRADSYEESLDEILDEFTRAKVESKFKEIYNGKEKVMLEDMERMREEEQVLNPRDFLRLV